MNKPKGITMKPRIKIALNSILIACGLLIAGASVGQTKRGLIVAIGDYGPGSKWRPISSLNDVPLVRSAMQKQGFDAGNINVLKNESATKKNIIGALQDFAKNSKAGDIVIIHFSSHGQQIEDDNGDELDGYDEAIVTYGAPTEFDPDYDFSCHIRDDELDILIKKIQAKVGKSGDVIVMADACHSGTVTRSERISR